MCHRHFHQIGSINLSHFCNRCSWLCVSPYLLVVSYICKEARVLFPVLLCSQGFTNNRGRYASNVAFVCLHITRYHHYASSFERTEHIKFWPGISCRVCLRSSQFSQESLSNMWGWNSCYAFLYFVKTHEYHIIIIPWECSPPYWPFCLPNGQYFGGLMLLWYWQEKKLLNKYSRFWWFKMPWLVRLVNIFRYNANSPLSLYQLAVIIYS